MIKVVEDRKWHATIVGRLGVFESHILEKCDVALLFPPAWNALNSVHLAERE